MIQHAERDRMLIAGAGAVVIHALFFAGLWLYAPQAAKLPIAVLPVYVELNAASIAAPRVASSTPAPVPPKTVAPAPVLPKVTTPAAQTPSSQRQAAPADQSATTPAPASSEYDPLAAPPTQSTPAAPVAPATQPTTAPAPAGPTAAELAQEQAQQQQLQRWRQSHPVDTQPSAPVAGTSSTVQAAPAQDAAGQALQRTINQTLNAVQSAPAAAPAGAGAPAGAPTAGANGTGTGSAGAAAAPTGAGSGGTGYSDPRLEFSNGQARGLTSKGRLELDPEMVKQILSQHPNHPPTINIKVEFQVDANGFVSNLQLSGNTSYTQLDQEIRNLFNGQVFVSAPGDPVAEGAIDYVIETHQ